MYPQNYRKLATNDVPSSCSAIVGAIAMYTKRSPAKERFLLNEPMITELGKMPKKPGISAFSKFKNL
jgi:hypothetical protein